MMKNKSGITLIALIVTIVILLILSVVTITNVNETKLFERSKTSVKKYADEQVLDDLKIYGSSNLTMKYTDEKPGTIVDFLKERPNYKLVDQNGNEADLSNEQAILGTQYDNYRIKVGGKVTGVTLKEAKKVINGTTSGESVPTTEVSKLKYPDNLASMTQEEIVKFNRQIDPECPEFTPDELVLKIKGKFLCVYDTAPSFLNGHFRLAENIDPNKVLVDFGDNTKSSIKFLSEDNSGCHIYIDNKDIHYVKVKKVDYEVENTTHIVTESEADKNYTFPADAYTDDAYIIGYNKIINFGEIGFTRIAGMNESYLDDGKYESEGNEILPIPNKHSFEKIEILTETFRRLRIETIPENLLWNATNLINTAYLFSRCDKLKEIPENLFDKNLKLNDTESMFANCVNVESNVPKLWKRTGDSAITNASSTFHGCTKAKNYNEIPSRWK